MEDANNTRLKINVLKGLRKYSAARELKHKKKSYIQSFYHRGLKRSSMIGFKMFSRMIDKEALKEKLEQRLIDFEQDYINRSFYS